VCSGEKVCKSCRSRKMQEKYFVVPMIGFDTTENRSSKVWVPTMGCLPKSRPTHPIPMGQINSQYFVGSSRFALASPSLAWWASQLNPYLGCLFGPCTTRFEGDVFFSGNQPNYTFLNIASWYPWTKFEKRFLRQPLNVKTSENYLLLRNYRLCASETIRKWRKI